MAEKAIQSVDLKNLKPREIGIMAFTALMLVGFLWYKFEFQPYEAKKKTAEKRLKEVEGLVAVFQQVSANPLLKKDIEGQIEQTGKEIEALREDIAKVKTLMAGKSLDILQQLKSHANNKGAKLLSLKNSEKVVAKGNLTYKEITILIKIRSDYDTVAEIVKRFADIPALLSLKSLETERIDAILPLVETQMQLELIVL
jgi:Tfp pilus assembly protein PilO